MATAFSESIPLAAGEEAVIESSGPITVKLTNGAVEVAGRIISTGDDCSFRSARKGIIVYSLEGGTIAVSAAAPMQVTRAASQVPCLLPIARAASRLPPGSRILVLGTNRGVGKTLAARTLVNLLFRDSITGKRGKFETVTLVCGDPSASSDGVAPGCISAVRVTRPGIAFGAPFLDQAHVTFFRADAPPGQSAAHDGAGGPPSATLPTSTEESAQTLHWLSQAIESSHAALVSNGTLTVVDVEAPPTMTPTASSAASLSSPDQLSSVVENYFTNVIDLVEPAMIVYVGGDDAPLVNKMVDRLPAAGGARNFQHVPPLRASSNVNIMVSSSQHYDAASSVENYFCGTPAYPMKCARVVVSLEKVSFLGVSRPQAGSGGGGGGGGASHSNTGGGGGVSPYFKPTRIDPETFHKQLVGRVCAVSLAAVEAEAAFANIAGLVLVDSINCRENELVVYAPAGGGGADDTCLVRPFLLVGDQRLRYRGGAVAAATV